MPSNLSNIGNSLLNGLFSVNLFSPGNAYDVNDPKYQKVFTIVGQNLLGGSFDFSNTILGRVIGPNTPIQKIGNVQLAKEFAYRIGFSVKSNVLPSIDLNNIFKGDPNKKILTSANYWNITKEERLGFSQIVQILTGFENGKNPFSKIGNGFTSSMSNAQYLENSGQGTIEIYKKLIQSNKYLPDTTIDENGNTSSERNIGYINNQAGPLSSIDNANLVDSEIDKFNPISTATDDFFYKKGNIEGTRVDPRTKESVPFGLLDFTQKIVNESDLDNNFNPTDKGNIIGNNINLDSKSFKSKELDNKGKAKEISKGRGIKNSDGSYCRNWIRKEQYEQYENTIRSRKLDASVLSVLKDPGTLKFHPTLDNEGNIDVKNMMFSLENLAFINSEISLKDYEKGLNGGRIMWFPPYDLNITESINANWETINFIGRNEPIYTYNGAERMINIGFKLIVDHPSILNNINFDSDEGIDKVGKYDTFFSGCFLPPENNNGLTEEQRAQLEIQKVKLEGITETKQIVSPNFPYGEGNPLKIYFDNNSYEIRINLVDSGSGSTATNTTLCANTITLANFLTKNEEGKKCKINIVGRTSSLGTSDTNETLGLNRGNAYKDYLLTFINQNNPEEANYLNDINRWNIITKGEENAQYSASSLSTVVRDATDRVVEVYLTYNPNLDDDAKAKPETVESKDNRNLGISVTTEALRTSRVNRYKDGGESRYFESLKKDDPFIFKKYSDKVKYFHPVFHSQTPEDFNSRLTFLQQCVRQGKSIGEAQNSIFGRAPVCVLRLGDFFHTKIIIESIQFLYEPLLWDLNPEGIGVQPMLCDVTMSCKIIGGQSLKKPLQELQTALSYNFYANTELYKKKE